MVGSRRVDKLLVMEGSRRVNKLLVIKDKLVLMLPCLFHKQLVYSSTRSLVHSSTNCLYLLNIKVNISIISI